MAQVDATAVWAGDTPDHTARRGACPTQFLVSADDFRATLSYAKTSMYCEV